MRTYAHWTYYESPLGWLCLSGNGSSIASLVMMDAPPSKYYSPVPDYLNFAVEQMEEYFAGTRKQFELKLDIRSGTDFQRNVWQYLLGIPYGKTTTYSRIAEDLGDAKAVRAVGRAIGANPIGIIIPCHRVIGVDGSLTGYAWGVSRKKKLLELENPGDYGVQSSLF